MVVHDADYWVKWFVICMFSLFDC